MAQPDPYDRQTLFSGTEASKPTAQLGKDLDKEFDEIHLTLGGVRKNLEAIQRDDLALANESVGIDQLKAEVRAQLNVRGPSGYSAYELAVQAGFVGTEEEWFASLVGPAAWQTPTAWEASTTYSASEPKSVVTQGGETYVCAVSHTSGTFDADLSASKWVKVAAKGLDPAWGSIAGDISAQIDLKTALDGKASAFHNHVVGDVAGLQGALDGKLDASSYTAGDVLAKIKTVDGAGSGLDADTLDGNDASAFSLSGHTHSYLPLSGGSLTGTLNLPANGLVVGTNQLVTSGNSLGIGTTSPSAKVHISGGSATNCNIRLTNTFAPRSWELNPYTTGDSDAKFAIRDVTAGFDRFILDGTGAITSQPTYDNTAAGSNVVVTSTGLIRRTSSSIKYKKDVESLDPALAANAIEGLRPVWYRTKNPEGDDKATWSHIGLIAEEVHEVEPRLVRYRTAEVTTDVEGNRIERELEVPEPEDVDYARLSVLLLAEIQSLRVRVAALEAA